MTRVLTNTPTVTWDFSTDGQAKATAVGGEGGSGSDPLLLTKGLSVNASTPQWIYPGDASNRRAVSFDMVTDSSTSNPDFSNETTLQITMYGAHGQNTNGPDGNQAKKTFHGLNIGCTYNASGQKFASSEWITAYGMGDTAVGQHHVFYAGGPVNGDEGQGFRLASVLEQQRHLNFTTINSIPTLSTMNTTIPGGVIKSTASQTVAVVSTAGAVVGDWVVIDQELPRGEPRIEAVQIEAIGEGTITAKFYFNHLPGVTVKPALVLDLTSTFQLGQDRFLVNLSATPYTTGTAHGHINPSGSGALTGIGTNWTVGMVGGNVLNVGAITLAADDITCGPFDATNRLRSWHQITQVYSPTVLPIWSYSVAADQAYKGRARGAAMAGPYEIRPCAKVLRITASPIPAMGRVICENSTSTWTVGDQLEQAICCYADSTGYQFYMGQWTPCGTTRGFMYIFNSGAVTHETGIALTGRGPIGVSPNADPVSWNTGIAMSSCNTGISIYDAKHSAILLSATQNGGRILWGADNPVTHLGGIELRPKTDVGELVGFKWQMTGTGMGGSLESFPSEGYSASKFPRLKFEGVFGVGVQPGGYLPTPSPQIAGTIGYAGNNFQVSWGDVVDYLGNPGGGIPSLVWCDGTSWRTFASAIAPYMTKLTAVVLSQLPVASVALKGTTACVADSTTNVWGATISGGGGNSVLAYCNGTNWTVAGK